MNPIFVLKTLQKKSDLTDKEEMAYGLFLLGLLLVAPQARADLRATLQDQLRQINRLQEMTSPNSCFYNQIYQMDLARQAKQEDYCEDLANYFCHPKRMEQMQRRRAAALKPLMAQLFKSQISNFMTFLQKEPGAVPSARDKFDPEEFIEQHADFSSKRMRDIFEDFVRPELGQAPRHEMSRNEPIFMKELLIKLGGARELENTSLVSYSQIQQYLSTHTGSGRTQAIEHLDTGYRKFCGRDGLGANAFYSNGYIVLCPGIAIGGNEGRIQLILGHEFGHAEHKLVPEIRRNLQKVAGCAEVVNMPLAYSFTRRYAGEIYADLRGTKVLAKHLQEKNLNWNQALQYLHNAVAPFCSWQDEGVAGSSAIADGSAMHPSGAARINFIMGADPEIRKAIGCNPLGPTVASCFEVIR